jgi:flagellar biosynthesis component FlhA
VLRVDPAQQGATFISEELEAMRARIEQRLGVQVPGVRVRGNPALAAGTYAILLYEALETKGEAVASQCCALASTEVLTRAGIPVYNVVAGVDAVTREPCSWVSPELTAALDAAGVEWLTDTGVVLRHLESVLERRLVLLFGVEDAEFLLQTWEADPERQELVDSVLRDDATRVAFGRLLRALLSERVPVTNAEEILGALRGADLSPAGLPDALRRMRLAVRESLPANADHVRRVRVPAEIEELVMTPALRPVDEYRALAELTALLSDATAVLVTRGPASRHRIRTLLERAGRFEGSVVSEDELVEPARTVVAVE